MGEINFSIYIRAGSQQPQSSPFRLGVSSALPRREIWQKNSRAAYWWHYWRTRRVSVCSKLNSSELVLTIDFILQKLVWGLPAAVFHGGLQASTQGRHADCQRRHARSGVQGCWDWPRSLLHCGSRHRHSLWGRCHQARGKRSKRESCNSWANFGLVGGRREIECCWLRWHWRVSQAAGSD